MDLEVALLDQLVTDYLSTLQDIVQASYTISTPHINYEGSHDADS